MPGLPRVDPRVCGAASAQSLPTGTALGRSPRVRGSRARASRRPARVGSIPACAGQPSDTSTVIAPVRVDPRVCGAATGTPRDENLVTGRSPRVRGSPSSWLAAREARGSIPACAGQPARQFASKFPRRVDPRVCGAAERRKVNDEGVEGRSPRVRGSLAAMRTATAGTGSIPACAGQPRGQPVDDGPRRVDPRVCGAASLRPGRSRGCRGRSPRVRGSRCGTHERAEHRGSIPACAGQPGVFVDLDHVHRVDPRVCGAATTLAYEVLSRLGRSPRVRGSLLRVDSGRFEHGSIPACAGQPCGALRFVLRLWVDPRVCGAARGARQGATTRAGRSPRVRGSRRPIR